MNAHPREVCAPLRRNSSSSACLNFIIFAERAWLTSEQYAYLVFIGTDKKQRMPSNTVNNVKSRKKNFFREKWIFFVLTECSQQSFHFFFPPKNELSEIKFLIYANICLGTVFLFCLFSSSVLRGILLLVIYFCSTKLRRSYSHSGSSPSKLIWRNQSLLFLAFIEFYNQMIL